MTFVFGSKPKEPNKKPDEQSVDDFDCGEEIL